MRSPAVAFHTAQETAILEAAGLAAAMGGVLRAYVEPPPNSAKNVGSPLPYILYGEDLVDPEDNGDCPAEAEIVAVVQWWARTDPLDGGAQARAMGAILVDVLVAELVLEGWTVDVVESQGESYSTDPDGSTRGRLIVRYQLTESPIESEA